MEPTTLIVHPDGKIVTSDTIIYFTTPCCNASATGTEHGVACRGCYYPIADDYGMATTINATNAIDDLTMMIAWLYNAPKITDKITDDAKYALRIAKLANGKVT